MKKKLLYAVAFFAITTNAQAIDLQAKIDSAVTEYNNGMLGKSADIFTEISDQLRAEKAKKLSVFLPAAPEGWVAEESDSLGSSMMGGASHSAMKYKKAESEIEVSFMTDNKLLDGLSSLASLGQSASSSKTYEGNSYTFEKDKYSEKYQFEMIFNDGLVISIEGEALTEELALTFMKAINLPELKAAAAK